MTFLKITSIVITFVIITLALWVGASYLFGWMYPPEVDAVADAQRQVLGAQFGFFAFVGGVLGGAYAAAPLAWRLFPRLGE